MLIGKKKRHITRSQLDEFPCDAQAMEMSERDERELGLLRCRQCFCAHNDGSLKYCEYCLLHPHKNRRKK